MKTIKNRNLLFLVILAGLTLSVSAAQDKTIPRERNVASFDKISVSSGIDLYLTQGNQEKVTVEANPDIIDRIVTRVEDGTLKIYIKNRTTREKLTWKKVKKVYVTFDDLKKLEVSAGSDVYSRNAFKLKDISIHCGSGSDLRIDNLTAESVNISTSSGSDASVSGKTITLRANSSSGSDLNCGKLASTDCEVSASSGSDAVVNVSGSLKARASSGGDVSYYGNPQHKDINESSGGDVKGHK